MTHLLVLAGVRFILGVPAGWSTTKYSSEQRLCRLLKWRHRYCIPAVVSRGLGLISLLYLRCYTLYSVPYTRNLSVGGAERKLWRNFIVGGWCHPYVRSAVTPFYEQGSGSILRESFVSTPRECSFSRQTVVHLASYICKPPSAANSLQN